MQVACIIEFETKLDLFVCLCLSMLAYTNAKANSKGNNVQVFNGLVFSI